MNILCVWLHLFSMENSRDSTFSIVNGFTALIFQGINFMVQVLVVWFFPFTRNPKTISHIKFLFSMGIFVHENQLQQIQLFWM